MSVTEVPRHAHQSVMMNTPSNKRTAIVEEEIGVPRLTVAWIPGKSLIAVDHS